MLARMSVPSRPRLVGVLHLPPLPGSPRAADGAPAIARAAAREAKLLASAGFELIVVENSLFGPTTTTAGLLVGADIRRALAGRADLDLALIPAECVNQDGLFLDDERFVTVREELPMPVYPSYDFIDVLSLEGEPAAYQTAA